MQKFLKSLILVLSFNSLVLGQINNITEEQSRAMMNEAMQIIWQQAMLAKEASRAVIPQVREELLENLCSSAPSSYFITHADLSDSLTSAENTSASVFVSSDGQSSWIQNTDVAPLNSPGFETTWGATTNVPNINDNVSWYLSGSLDSESLGLSFGQVTVSQSPYNSNNMWPPSDNLYAVIANDDTGETGSGQDIVNLKATYSDDKIYASLGLNGSCCNDGSFFGPWNLYAIAIVNPDAENPVAYAYGYGNGGFGQLYPAIYKIDGDLTTGEVSGFEVLSENFDYSTAGNSLQASSLLSIITNDSGWGEWPNSFNGIGLVGVTIEAGLDGIDIAIELLDQSDVGVLVLSTQSQTSNTAPVLSNPEYSDGVISVTYQDFENNLATAHDVFIDDMGFVMIPNSHTYAEGVVFSAEIGSGHDTATLSFSDGAEYVQLDLELDGGGCQLLGDANGDTTLNVLDVVLTVNLILSGVGNYEVCSDINSDNSLNVLDIVLLVNLILGSAQ